MQESCVNMAAECSQNMIEQGAKPLPKTFPAKTRRGYRALRMVVWDWITGIVLSADWLEIIHPLYEDIGGHNLLFNK